jgi:hypothetical protein
VTPLDIHLDFTAAQLDQMAVSDGDGQRLPRWALPPGGGGVDWQFVTFKTFGLLLVTDLTQATPAYDLGIDWWPTTWTGTVDFGARAEVALPARWPVTIAFDAGEGLRVAVLEQPWWDDYFYVGLGVHVGAAATFGRGPIRPLLGVRGGFTLVPGAASGTLDSAAQDMSWSWTPSGWSVGVHAGVAIRGKG